MTKYYAVVNNTKNISVEKRDNVYIFIVDILYDHIKIVI